MFGAKGEGLQAGKHHPNCEAQGCSMLLGSFAAGWCTSTNRRDEEGRLCKYSILKQCLKTSAGK